MAEHIWEPYPIKEQIHISDMYSFFRIYYEYGFAFSGETHNFWECFYVMKGTVCVSADERIYYLNAGEIIFHKPMELHKFTITSPEGADLLIFSFAAEGNLTTQLKDKVFKLSSMQSGLITSLLEYISEKISCHNVPFRAQQYLEPGQRINSEFVNLKPCKNTAEMEIL